MYKTSIMERRVQATLAVGRVQKSLASLKNKSSTYAAEHKALLEVYLNVLQVYMDAPDDIALKEVRK